MFQRDDPDREGLALRLVDDRAVVRSDEDAVRGQDRLDYLRGDNAHEVAQSPGGIFRDRSTPLGDVVNSNPIVVGRPNFGYSDSLESVAYSSFKAAYADTECRDTAGNLRSLAALDRGREVLLIRSIVREAATPDEMENAAQPGPEAVPADTPDEPEAPGETAETPQ